MFSKYVFDSMLTGPAAILCMSVATTGLARGQDWQFIHGETGDAVRNRQAVCLVDPKSRLIQSPQGSGTDSADDNGLDIPSAQGLDRLAGTMRMMLVIIVEGAEFAGFGVDDDKLWC